MANSNAAIGWQAQCGFGAANPVTIPVEVEVDGLQARRSRVQSEGVRGTRQRIHETTGDGPIVVAGDVSIRPTYTALAAMLPFIMGATASGSNPTTYAFAETNQNYGSGLKGFYWTADRKTKVFTYAGVNVAKAVFSTQQGLDMKTVLSLVAQTETIGAAGSFPSLTFSTDSPFMWSSAILTLNGITREVKDWSLTIDNKPITDRFNNSQTATQFPFTDFTVELDCNMPFTADEVDLYNVALLGDVSATLVLTDTDSTSGGPGNVAAHTLTFTFGKMDWASETPTMPGRALEIPTRAKFVSRKQTQGTITDSLSITM
ncbi:MAG TPA: phage tail tube protein [Gemmataceae bacterium]|nr:phage tail tube protein [Gemmataceae bacterium]